MSTSYERLLHLAQKKLHDGSEGLAMSLARTCLDSKVQLEPEVRALAFDVTKDLIQKVKPQIRRRISEHLSEFNDVPEELLEELINESAYVAYPLLLRSLQLTEDKLINIIHNYGTAYAEYIAQRPKIGLSITDALVSTDQESVMYKLLENNTAEISSDGMSKIVEKSRVAQSLQKVLLLRQDMPEHLLRRLYLWVGDAIKSEIEYRFDMEKDSVGAETNQAVFEAMDAVSIDEKGRKLEKNFTSAYNVNGKRINQLLWNGFVEFGIEGLLSAFKDVTGISQSFIKNQITTEFIKTIITICCGTGISEDKFIEILNKNHELNSLSEEIKQQAIAEYNNLDPMVAANDIRRWRAVDELDNITN